MTTRRPPITLGNGINIGLAIVLIGAAWQLGEKVADMRVAQADSQGDIKALTASVSGLARAQDQMRDDLKDLDRKVQGISDAERK
jgi:hypothetical protein